jgi:ABC-type phosphate transport system substrate-binding protein
MVYVVLLRWLSLAATAAWLLLTATSPVAAQERITIGGAGMHIPVMQVVADAYNARYPSPRVEVLGKTLGSTGGIRAVEAGAVAIGLVSSTRTFRSPV